MLTGSLFKRSAVMQCPVLPTLPPSSRTVPTNIADLNPRLLFVTTTAPRGFSTLAQTPSRSLEPRDHKGFHITHIALVVRLAFFLSCQKSRSREDAFSYVPTETSEPKIDSRHGARDAKTEFHEHGAASFPCTPTRQQTLTPAPSGLNELDNSVGSYERCSCASILPGISELDSRQELRVCPEMPADIKRSP